LVLAAVMASRSVQIVALPVVSKMESTVMVAA
jgi:hypothetical protein